ncbi:uncharacterized protein LOC144003042 isoform X2 [Festucalex cinctus]
MTRIESVHGRPLVSHRDGNAAEAVGVDPSARLNADEGDVRVNLCHRRKMKACKREKPAPSLGKPSFFPWPPCFPPVPVEACCHAQEPVHGGPGMEATLGWPPTGFSLPQSFTPSLRLLGRRFGKHMYSPTGAAIAGRCMAACDTFEKIQKFIVEPFMSKPPATKDTNVSVWWAGLKEGAGQMWPGVK